MSDQISLHSTGESSLTELVERLQQYEGPPQRFLQALLAVQCRVGPAQAAAVFRRQADQSVCLAAHPDPDADASTGEWLRHVRDQLPDESITEARLVAYRSPRSLYGVEPTQRSVMFPLRRDGGIRGIAVFLVDEHEPERLEAIRQRLELTTSLLTLYETRLTAERRAAELRRLRHTQHLLAAVNEHTRWTAASMGLCNHVASQWEASRVAVGVLRGRYVKVQALSHTEKFTRKMQLVQDIESAMEECLDQDVELTHPADASSGQITRATEELATRHGPSAVCLLPLREQGEARAVLCVERGADRPFTVEELETLRLASEQVAPRLLEMHDRDRWLGARAAAATRRVLSKALGPEHTWVKLLVLGVVTGVILLATLHGQYRVEGSFVVEAAEKRIIAAPYAGYLAEVNVEPGDLVGPEGVALARMQTHELELELAEVQAELLGYMQEAAIARRDGETADEEMAHARAEQARARIDLLEHRIERAALSAAVAGVVTEGDHRRRIGSRVDIGEALFEVAELDTLRAQLAVPENRIADVEPGQRGELAATAHPTDRIPFEVEWINPVAEADDQDNVFHVRVRLEETRPWLRPGMEGVGKIDVDRRLLVSIWSRDLIEWIRMRLWL